jgi:hypothetical protein
MANINIFEQFMLRGEGTPASPFFFLADVLSGKRADNVLKGKVKVIYVMKE